MFHVMLILPILIFGILFLAVLAGLLLFAIAAIAAAVIGGTSVALLVKNKIVKKLMFIGFSIIFLIGATCLLPALIAFADLSSSVAFVLAVAFAVIIMIVSILGIKTACKLSSEGAKTILIVIFGIILAILVGILGTVFFYVAFVAA